MRLQIYTFFVYFVRRKAEKKQNRTIIIDCVFRLACIKYLFFSVILRNFKSNMFSISMMQWFTIVLKVK